MNDKTNCVLSSPLLGEIQTNHIFIRIRFFYIESAERPCLRGNKHFITVAHTSVKASIISGSRLFVQQFAQQNEKVIKTQHHQLLRGSSGDQYIPSKRASDAESVSVLWRHHALHRCSTPRCQSISAGQVKQSQKDRPAASPTYQHKV